MTKSMPMKNANKRFFALHSIYMIHLYFFNKEKINLCIDEVLMTKSMPMKNANKRF